MFSNHKKNILGKEPTAILQYL